MIQKEIHDSANTRWQCVQAYTVTDSVVAAQLVERKQVDVICTPSGGEQTVRLKLDNGWEENLGDEELLKKIEQSKALKE